MKDGKSVRPALPASRGFGLTIVSLCISGAVIFGFAYFWGDGDIKGANVQSAALGQVMKAAPNITAFPSGVNLGCAAVGSASGNPYGHAEPPCVVGRAEQTHVTPTVPANNWLVGQRAASQEVVDSIATSRNRTTKAVEVVNQAAKCHEGMSTAQIDQCVIVFGAQRQAVASLAQFASSGDIVAKFELARLIFKEQMGASVTQSWMLSAIDKTIPVDGEDWSARALQLLNDAAAQGHPPAVEQLERINRGEGFLVD